MAGSAVTLNDLGDLSPVAGFFKCNRSNTCTAFYTIRTDSVLARFLCISRGFVYYDIFWHQKAYNDIKLFT